MRIPGKLKAEDFERLIELVRGKTVLALGCYCGRGLLTVAEHAEKVWVLEDFKRLASVDGVVRELMVNIDRYAPEERVMNLLYGNSDRWTVPVGSEQLPEGGVDVVYRDADRSEAEWERDEQLAYVLLRNRGGVYAWHDEDHALCWLQMKPMLVTVN